MQFPCFFDTIHVTLFVVSGITYILRYDLYEKDSPDTMISAYDKVFPVMLLAAYVSSMKQPYTNHPNEYTELFDFVFLGLLLSSLGDVCLIFPQTFFIPGILFFMITQVFYSRAFGNYTGSKRAQTVFVLVWMAGFIFIQLNITSYMIQMIFMSYSYLLMVSGMRATAKCEIQPSIGAFIGCVGTILFISSHALIAINKWVIPVAKCEFLVMVTYYGAQLGIVLGTTKSRLI